MKLTMLFKGLLLSVFLSAFAYAAPAGNAAAKPAKKEQQSAAKSEDKMLKDFNSSLLIKLTERGMTMDEKGQPVAFARYDVDNKGTTDITRMSWVAVFLVNGEAIFSKEVDVKFPQEPYFSTKSQINLDVQMPLKDMPPITRAIFESRDIPITSQIVAKDIQYVDNKKNNKRIVVK